MTSTYAITRPIMTGAELAEHHIGRNGRDYSESDDGWSDMEAESKRGWKPLPCWGRDGWDLGDWPYVSFQVRYLADRDGFPNPARVTVSGADSVTGLVGPYQLQQICEGDRDRYAFDSQEDLYAALDYLFLWSSADEDWSPITHENREHREHLVSGALRIDERFRGPYRSED